MRSRLYWAFTLAGPRGYLMPTRALRLWLMRRRLVVWYGLPIPGSVDHLPGWQTRRKG